jgi:hypothetical protein
VACAAKDEAAVPAASVSAAVATSAERAIRERIDRSDKELLLS